MLLKNRLISCLIRPYLVSICTSLVLCCLATTLVPAQKLFLVHLNQNNTTEQDSKRSNAPLLTETEQRLSSGQGHSYKVSLNADDYLKVTISQHEANLAVIVYDPAGNRITNFVSVNHQEEPNILVNFIAAKAGTYRLDIFNIDSTTISCIYNFKVNELHPATSEDRKKVDSPAQLVQAQTLALAGTDTGDYEQTIAYYQKLLRVKRNQGDDQAKAIILSNIGTAYSGLKQDSAAIDYFNQALIVFARISDRVGESITWNNLGRSYLVLGQNRDALDSFQQALKLKRQLQDTRGEATTLDNIGYLYTLLSEQPSKQPLTTTDSPLANRQAAIAHLKEALSLWQKLNDTGQERITAAMLAKNSLNATSQDIAQTTKDPTPKVTGVPQNLPHNTMDNIELPNRVVPTHPSKGGEKSKPAKPNTPKAPSDTGNQTTTQNTKVAKKEEPDTVSPSSIGNAKPNDAKIAPTTKLAKGQFAIQVGAISSKTEADQLCKKLRAGGVTPYVIQTNVPGKGILYRIRLGQFQAREDAQKTARNLKAKGVINDYFVTAD